MDKFLGIIASLKLSSEVIKLLSELDEFKGAWQFLGRLTPERLSVLKKVATIESIGSSTRIEGSKLSDHEVELLLTNSHNHFESRDEQEVAGYSDVCKEVCENFTFIPFNENAIKQLHSWLLKYSEKDDGHRGEYKNLPIRIEAFDGSGKSIGTIIETTSPLETPIQMNDLIRWTVRAFHETHPLIVIAIFVVLFLAIHPFQDGNGRLSRLLTTLLMLQQGYHYVPYSSLESIVEQNKEHYYKALQRTQKAWQQGKPEWNEWLLFFLNCLQRQKRHLEIKLEKEKLIIKQLSPLGLEILNHLKQYDRLQLKQLVSLTQANRNTLKKTLASMVKNGYITLHSSHKSSWYSI